MQTDPTPPANLPPAQLADRLQHAVDTNEPVSFAYMGGMQGDTGATRSYQCRQIPQIWYTVTTPRVRGQWGTGTRVWFAADMPGEYDTVRELIAALRAVG
jgi:hypothetical protein